MAPVPSSSRPCLLAPRPTSDEDAIHTPQSMPLDEVRAQLEALKHLEMQYRPQDYMDRSSVGSDCCDSYRVSIVEYLYRMVDLGKFSRNTVAYAVSNIMDRYLSLPSNHLILLDQDKYEMVALTSLFVASKLLEGKNIGVDTLVSLADGDYTEQDFVNLEQSILTSLQWKVGHGPTALSFVELYLQFLPKDSCPILKRSMLNHVKYQLELAVPDYDLMIHNKPSELALAAIYNALEGVDSTLIPPHKQKLFCSTLLNILCHVDGSCMSYDFKDRISKIQLDIQHLLYRVICYVRDKETASRARPQEETRGGSQDAESTTNIEKPNHISSGDRSTSGSPVTVVQES